jgi:segregation and condensation protein A
MTGAAAGAADDNSVDPAVSDWEDPPRADRSDTAPVLAVDGFEGPLDWWLEMARAQKIDFSKISIAALIGAFATALETALADRTATGKLAHYASWTVTAATLTELWSRLLLPQDAPAARAAVEEAEALRRHWLERARLRAAADWLDRRPQLSRDVFRRGQPEIGLARSGADLTDLLRACLAALLVPEEAAVALQPRPPPLWTASNALAQLARLLPVLPDGSPLDAYLPTIAPGAPRRALRQRAALASTLIAALERARDGALLLEQDAAWRPIRLTRRVDDTPPADDTETPA